MFLFPSLRSPSLQKRQFWWYDDSSAWQTKWAIFGGVVFGLIVILALAYIHARHRLQNGKQPLRYHAWMVQNRIRWNQAQEAREAERVRYREEYHVYPSYAMNTFSTPAAGTDALAPPPPAYDPRYPAPPTYVAPADAKQTPPYPYPPPGELESSGSSDHNVPQSPFDDQNEVRPNIDSAAAAQATTAEEYERLTAEQEHEAYYPPPSSPPPNQSTNQSETLNTSRQV
ncbi:hypothetical protein BZA70DRAFT_275409 [Myxozyma melibiosi]|uniref:Uncharacterized protein n=1 Tax=Myxozyma melibiosi TaxID=54550 RepID=A0ABR1FAU3_9ASCO